MCQVEIVFIRKMGAGMGQARGGRGMMWERPLCEGDIEAATGGEKGKTRPRVSWGLPAGPAAAAWNPVSFSPCPVAGGRG